MEGDNKLKSLITLLSQKHGSILVAGCIGKMGLKIISVGERVFIYKYTHVYVCVGVSLAVFFLCYSTTVPFHYKSLFSCLKPQTVVSI